MWYIIILIISFVAVIIGFTSLSACSNPKNKTTDAPPDSIKTSYSKDEVKKLLDIPAQLDILAILPFGYPVEAIGRGKKKRKPLSEVAHRGKFGQPFV